ncbi:MAG TPA: PTS sugar transporter subunit IIA [Clostridia bacterium]|nr:PTS sugar transporter subunit IIA [Clostridia bacterium]
MLSEVLSKDKIIINPSVENWREAIKAAGNLLLADEIVTREYVQAMITSVEEKGPYIVIAPGIAIAHARPEDGVNDLGMSLAILEKPIKFGNKDNDPVKIVFSFSSPDNKRHLEVFQQLTTLLMRDNFVENISKATTPEEVLDYIFEK